MRDFLEELAVVLSQSTRTTLALVLAFVLPLLILIFGDYMTTPGTTVAPDNLQLLQQAAMKAIYWRYIAAAMVTLFSFMGVAIRCYQRDRRRLLYL